MLLEDRLICGPYRRPHVRLLASTAPPGGARLSFLRSTTWARVRPAQAIQNLNCVLGLPETEGLDWPGGFV